MEMLLLRHSTWESMYNCTGFQQELEAKYTFEERSYPLLSCTVIALCSIYLVLYIPCMFSLWKRVSNSVCYKFMFYIGIIDIGMLFIIGYYQAYLSLQGASYCVYPLQNYIVGCFLMFGWVGESTADVVLALNRCLDMISSELAEVLFEGNRAYIWLGLVSTYAFYCFAFTFPGIFVPMYFSTFFNPFTGWVSYVNNVQDLVCGLGSTLLYLFFVVALALKVRKNRQMTNSTATDPSTINMQRMIFLQVASISFLNTATGLLYVYFENFTVQLWMVIFAYFCWLHIHGLPPVIYLALNKTMRSDCRGYWNRIVGIFRPQKTSPGGKPNARVMPAQGALTALTVGVSGVGVSDVSVNVQFHQRPNVNLQPTQRASLPTKF